MLKPKEQDTASSAAERTGYRDALRMSDPATFNSLAASHPQSPTYKSDLGVTTPETAGGKPRQENRSELIHASHNPVSLQVESQQNLNSDGEETSRQVNSAAATPGQAKKIIINTSRSEYPIIDEVAREVLGWRVSKEFDPARLDFDLWWSDLPVDSSFVSGLKNYQKVNHFVSMYQISRKTFLAKNLKRLQKLYP